MVEVGLDGFQGLIDKQRINRVELEIVLFFSCQRKGL